MSSTIHFYIRTDRPAKNGMVQIYLKFTLNRNNRVSLSTGKYIGLKKEYQKLKLQDILNISIENRNSLYCWDNQKERSIKGTENWEKINQYLDGEKSRANDIIIKYELINKPITTELFKTAFTKPNTGKTFYDYFMHEILVKRKNLISKETLRDYCSIITKTIKFKPNLTLGDIDYKFLSSYENYMLKPINEGGLGNVPNTVSKTMKILRTLSLIAIKNGDFLAEHYPFKHYSIKTVDSELTSRDYLEPDEILKLEQLLSIENIEKLTEGEVRAVKRFLFACYTGLRFRDVNGLSKEQHIFSKWVLNPQTNEMVFRYYIELKMHKTSHSVFIPLIDKALELIDLEKGGSVFQPISNQKINEHLKSINNKAKLNKHLTFHVARHSFATICFLYEIPEKVGQKLLGHKNPKFTAIYTHLSQNKLFYEMDKLNRGLNTNYMLVEELDENNKRIKEILPDISKLSAEKLEKLKELIRLIG